MVIETFLLLYILYESPYYKNICMNGPFFRLDYLL